MLLDNRQVAPPPVIEIEITREDWDEATRDGKRMLGQPKQGESLFKKYSRSCVVSRALTRNLGGEWSTGQTDVHKVSGEPETFALNDAGQILVHAFDHSMRLQHMTPGLTYELDANWPITIQLTRT